jgi:hypothetical protein
MLLLRLAGQQSRCKVTMRILHYVTSSAAGNNVLYNASSMAIDKASIILHPFERQINTKHPFKRYININMAPHVNTTPLSSMVEYMITGIDKIDHPLKDTDCTICCDALRASSNNTIRLKPCQHKFHRSCIRQWFLTQSLKARHDKLCKFTTCPNCRSGLFDTRGLSSDDIATSCMGLDMLGERSQNPKVQDIVREAERRFRTKGRITEEVVTWVLQQFAESSLHIEQQYRGTRYLSGTPAHLMNFRLDGLRRINVNTEQDQVLLKQTVRNDAQTLLAAISQGIATEVEASAHLRTQNWIAVTDWTLSHWRACGYPHSNYITIDSLHRFSISAGLVYNLLRMPRWNNKVEYAQLLAYADRLLLRAQQEARSTPRPGVEYVRLLDSDPKADVRTHGLMLCASKRVVSVFIRLVLDSAS